MPIQMQLAIVNATAPLHYCAISALSDTVSYWLSLLVLLYRDTRPAMAAAAAIVLLSFCGQGEQTHQTSLTCRTRRKTLFAHPEPVPSLGV